MQVLKHNPVDEEALQKSQWGINIVKEQCKKNEIMMQSLCHSIHHILALKSFPYFVIFQILNSSHTSEINFKVMPCTWESLPA